MVVYRFFALLVCFLFFGNGASAKDSITVYIFMLDECRICQELAPELNEIYDIYHSQAIGFVGVFPNFSSKPKGIQSFKSKYKVAFNTQTDYFKKITHRFDATVLPEVVVYNETKDVIIYRGLVNDLFYSPGKRRHNVQNHFLRNALDATIKGQPIKVAETTPIGCYINFNDSLTGN